MWLPVQEGRRRRRPPPPPGGSPRADLGDFHNSKTEVLGFFRDLLRGGVACPSGDRAGDRRACEIIQLAFDAPLISLREFFLELDLGKARGELDRLQAEMDCWRKGLESPSATIRETAAGVLGATSRFRGRQEASRGPPQGTTSSSSRRGNHGGSRGSASRGHGLFLGGPGGLDTAIAAERARQEDSGSSDSSINSRGRRERGG